MKEIPVRPIFGPIDPVGKTIGEITGEGAKAFLCVNVASNSFLTNRNYK